MSEQVEADGRLFADQIKSCCAALYASDWARLLLGDSFHPGGPALTLRLGEMLGIGPGARVLDVAAGSGTSAIHLAQRFDCRVTGVDFSYESVRTANERAREAGLADRARFVEGDAERLGFEDGSFDAVVCECAFCTFPDKASATAEFARVLRPGAKLGLADLTRAGALPDSLEGLLAWIACLGDARPLDEYAAYLRGAGFAEPVVEDHGDALREMVVSIRGRLLGAEVLAKLGRLQLPVGSLEQAKQLATAAASAIDEGRLGYSLLVAAHP